MTRAQAVRKYMNAMGASGLPDDCYQATYWAKNIDAFVALGIIKLDEPKKESGPMLNEVEHMTNAIYRLGLDPDYAPLIVAHLHFSGLKIVEK